MRHRNLQAFLAAIFLAGCSSIRIEDKERGVVFKAMMPAWPWSDSQRILDRMNISRHGTNFTASLRGLTETETVSTNFAGLLEAVTAGAVKGAIGALPK